MHNSKGTIKLATLFYFSFGFPVCPHRRLVTKQKVWQEERKLGNKGCQDQGRHPSEDDEHHRRAEHLGNWRPCDPRTEIEIWRGRWCYIGHAKIDPRTAAKWIGSMPTDSTIGSSSGVESSNPLMSSISMPIRIITRFTIRRITIGLSDME